jgi:cation diffusion facilitator CzcD-associated flavoprotein CzcO/pimeloyl-ACP methyl ester carboxylesterase
MTEHVRVAVIGAGFGGLGTAVRLRREGITDFVVLERADAVGGTWRDNGYPGCACDVPSHLYSFSFAPNPAWPRTFSGQPDIRAYLERVADTFGLRPHIRLGAELEQARWDTAANRWRLRTTTGDELTSDVLVSATGPLSDPELPDIPGLADFPGAVFHTSRWDHGYDVEGKRVVVVGTGASAVQIVPAIQPDVRRLTVVQRTPPWILPRMDRAVAKAEQWLHGAVPATAKARRALLWLIRECQVGAFAKWPRLMRLTEQVARAHLRRAIADPRLRAVLTPDYTIGCKRILLSNDYYPALTRPNAEVVASPLREVRGSSVVMADGTEREADAIVFGTGFRVQDMPIGHRVTGADGRTLAEHWKDEGMAALRGTTVDGFPNLLVIIGPNAGLGNNSMILIIESQLNYVIDYLRTLDATGAAALDARPEAVRAWNDGLQRRMARTVWNTGGCDSWYLDADGRNTTIWPGTTAEFRRATSRVDPTEYEPLGVPGPRRPTDPATPTTGQPAGAPGQAVGAGTPTTGQPASAPGQSAAAGTAPAGQPTGDPGQPTGDPGQAAGAPGQAVGAGTAAAGQSAAAGSAPAGQAAGSAGQTAAVGQAADRYAPVRPCARRTVRSADGTRIHAEEYGSPDGPAVVLVHGWTCSTLFWAPVVRALADDGYRVIAYDQRGHGRSALPRKRGYSTDALADDLDAVLSVVLADGQRAVLAGHSMGGMTAMAGGERPGVQARTAAVLLISTGSGRLLRSAQILPPSVRSQRVRDAFQRFLLTCVLPLGPQTALTRAALKYGVLGAEAATDTVAATARIVHACKARPRAAWGRVLAGLNLDAGLAAIQAPTVVLVGTADKLTPPQLARSMAARLPNCEGLIELPGLGHMTPLEAPDAVADAIRRLIRDHPAAEAV